MLFEFPHRSESHCDIVANDFVDVAFCAVKRIDRDFVCADRISFATMSAPTLSIDALVPFGPYQSIRSLVWFMVSVP